MKRSDRGMALLLVLGAVALLVVLAVELAARANVDVMRATRSSRDAAFRRLFDSGMEVARGLLSEAEDKPYDYWGDRWNRTVSFTLRAGETLTLRMADESGKINVARQEESGRLKGQLARLFEHLRRYKSGGARRWNETEDLVMRRLGLREGQEGGGGRGPLQGAKPDPIFTLDGLREAGLGREDIFAEDGLSRYLTCFGDGKININCAPRAVLYAVDSELDDLLVERISNFRGDPEGRAGEFKPFQKPEDLDEIEGVVARKLIEGRMKVVRNLREKLGSRVTTRSAAFSVRMEAEVDGRRRRAWAFFETRPAPEGAVGIGRDVRRLAFEELEP